MRVLLLLLTILFLSSCLEKIEGVDSVNTNIFDKEYAGDCWFTIEDSYLFYNDFGQQKVMVEAVLPKSNAPGLKPSLIFITCQVNNQQEIIFNSYIDNKGNYPFYVIASPETSNEYCLNAGLYLTNEDTTINRFILCTQP